MRDIPTDAGSLRLNAGGLFAAVSELAEHDPAHPSLTYDKIVGPPRRVADGVFVITRHADCEAVLRDPRVLRSTRTGASFEGQGTSFLTGLDAPEHTRVRRALSNAFSPRAIERIRIRVESLVDDCLDDADDLRCFDLAAGFSRTIPLTAVCALIGIPAADQPFVAELSGPVSYGADMLAPPRTRAQQRENREALIAFRQLLRGLLQTRREEPADDLISRLAHPESGTEPLSDKEIVTNMMGLLVAGHETTASAIGHGLLNLISLPDSWDRMASGDADFADRVVEETLRLDCPVQATPRVAGENLAVGGVEIPQGSSLVILFGAANRDPEAYVDPQRFDPDRRDAPRHLALGTGMHYCLGATLGRLETRTALIGATRRIVNPHLAVDGVAYAPGWGIRSPSRIEIGMDRMRSRRTLAQAAS